VRRLTGVVAALSATLVLVALPSTGAAEPTEPASPATKILGAPAAKPKVTAAPLPAKAARAAADVDLPRPVRGATALRLLGDHIDEAAALNEMPADELVDLLSSDDSAWVDSEGALFYKDAAAPATRDGAVAAASAPLDQTFTLHSKPGSQHTIFLDFDGASVSGSRWQAEYAGVPTTQPAWDPTGNGAGFDDSELTSIQAIWASVAEDYAPFDVDVTTADPGAAAINRSGPGDVVYGSHVVVSPGAATSAAICQSECGGAAFRNAFGATAGGAGGDGYGYQQPAWVFPDLLGPDSPKAIAEAVSHEVGHQLGLSHDGSSTSDQDAGHGAWAPIMGTGEAHPISQWSKGDYDGATNHEDDLATIRSVLGARTDEAGGSVAQAPALPTGTSYITSRTDVDVYLLGACTGALSVTASPIDAQADLDIRLTLLSATGSTVATADPASAQTSPTTASGLDASITEANASGTYYVAVDGTGNGPWTTGYDDYGSLGAYTLSSTGSCNGASLPGVPSKANGLAATPDPLMANVALSWSNPTTPGAGGAVTAYLLTRTGSDDYVQVPASTTSYTWTGLTFGTGYTFTVTPLNASGAGVASSVSTVTSTGVVVPGAPRALTAAWNPVPQTAVVAWSAPRTAGSAPVQFYALYLDGVLYNHYTPSTTGLQFAGLSPGATYTFGVAAVSSAAIGPVTTASVAVPSRAANDAFAQRSALSGVSGSVAGNNTESSDEAGEPAPTATRAGAGKASVWYSWTAPASGPVTMTTTSSTTDRDTTLDAFTGTSVGSLSKVAGNDDPSGGGRLAAVTFDATAGSTYAIGINGYRTSATGVGPFTLSWTGTAIGAKGTTTDLTAVAGASARSVNLTAAVSASFGTPAGHVYFYDGATQVGDDFLNSSSPSPSLTVTDLARGDHVFTAKFVPTQADLYAESTSPATAMTIAASATATTLQGSADGQQVTLNAAVASSVAGTVQFRDGSTLVGTGTVAYGKSTIVLTGVAPGAHSYTATFVPSDLERYVGSTSTAAAVTVPAYPAAKSTTTTLTGQLSGRTASLVATVAATGSTPAGTVQVKDGTTVVGTATLSGGSTSITLGDLTHGTHQLTATFVPADATAFATSTSTATSLVVAATPTATALSTSLSGRTVTLQTTVSPSAAGEVRLREGSTLVGTVTLSGGTGQLVLTNVTVGTHHYKATFVPTDDLRYAGSTSPTQDVTVDPAATATALGSTVSVHEVTLTATVTSAAGAAAGSVTFREGGDTVGSGTVAAGVASLTLAGVATGAHTYTATFTPTDSTQQAGSVSPNQTATVVATPTTTDLSTSVAGQVVTLTGSVTAAGSVAGKVEFREGSTLVGTVPLASGSAVLTLSGVAPGAHSYVATFVPSGTTHATSSSSSKTATAKGATATTLEAAVAGTAVTLTAAVTGPGTPAGTVEFREGAALLGTKALSGGVASLTLSSVAAGDHSYVATFVPTVPSTYAGSFSEALVVDVARIATATTLTATVTGQSVLLSSAVTAASGTLTGSVQFREGTTVVGTTTLSAGAAAVTLTGVTPGVHSYTARFLPTGTVHSGSSSPTRAATILGTTSTALTTSVTGRTVTATAVVTSDGTTPAGSVTFYRDGTQAGTVTLASGTAVYTATDVVPGAYNYTAAYVPGSAVSAASSSGASVATVGTIPSTTTLEATASGRSVTLDTAVTVTSGSAAGKVQFRDGDTLVGTKTVASGAASLTLSTVTPGDHTYTASFVPTDPTVYVGSDSSEETVTADRIGTTTALLASASAQTVTLTATPATASGRLTGSVEFRDGATLVETVTLSETTVVLTLDDVTPGSHTYTATFVPTDATTYAGSTSPDRTVTAAERSSATDLAATVDVRTVTLDAAVASGSRKPPGNVVFRDGTTVVGTVALDEGEAQLELSLVTPGSHAYTATFVATDPTTYTGSASPSRTLSVLPVVTTTDLTATQAGGQTVKLAAQVAGASGVPSGNVVLREGGTVLGTVAVVAGSALLDLADVVPGDHTYTATFVPTNPAFFERSTSPARSATVDPIATETDLTATADVSTVRLEAEVDTDAAGKVVFRDGGTAVGQVTVDDQVAVLELTDVEPGAHTYTATFVPSDPTTYAGSVSPGRSVTVKVRTSTDLAASAVQRSVSLTATVTGAGSPAGDVEFREGTTLVGTVPVAAGNASVTLTGVGPGTHSYQATFVPATPTTVAGSESAVRSTTVAPIDTTTILSTDVDGDSVTLDATVTRSGGGSLAGTVDFRDGSTLVGTTPLLGGAAAVRLTDVAPGDHAYRAFFTPSDPVSFGFSSTGPQFTTVAPVATHTDLGLSTHGRTVTFETTVSSSYAVPAGSVIIREGSKIVGTADLEDGASVLDLAGVDPGQHTYTATYVPAPGGAHLGSTSPQRDVTVAVPTSTVLTATASVRAVTLRAVVTPMRGTPAGSVELREGATVVGTVLVESDGVASTTLTDVTPGEHTYTATFVPTDPVTLAGSDSPERTVTVDPIVTTTALDTEVAVRTVTLSAAVTGASDTPAGNVVFRDGIDVVGTVALHDGAAATTLTGVAPGEHTYTATFVPTDGVLFAGSGSTGGRVTVDPIVTTTALETHVAVRVVTLAATVTGASGTPTGQVEFREGAAVVGTAAVAAGVASLNLPGVSPGEHSYTAAFVPTSAVTYAGSVSPEAEATVDPIVTTTQLTATADGRTVTLAAAIGAASGTPAGQVQFREGAAVLGTVDLATGAASTTLTNVAPGDHTYTATFLPTEPVTFAGSSSAGRTVTIGRIPTSTGLVAAASGQTVTLTAKPTTDDGTLTGAVEFREGSTLLGTVTLSGTTAVLTLPDVIPGQHTYTATFAPTGTVHATSSAQRQVTVPNATAAALTVTAVGGRVTLSALVTSAAGVPKGTVEFYDGDTSLGAPSGVGGDGVAGLTVEDVLGGTHTYGAVFVPDVEEYMGSSTTSAYTVDPTATTTDLVAERTPGSRSVVLTADVSAPVDSPAGSVTFRDGATVVATEPVAGGRATATLTSVTTGVHDYEATFVPTSATTYAGSDSPPAQLTMAASTTTTEIAVSSLGATVTVTATVTSADGVPTGTVQLTQDGETVPALGQLVAGEATVTLVHVDAGEHTYVATYVPEDASYAASTSPGESGKVTVTIPAGTTTTSLNVSVVGRTVTLSAAVTSPDGAPSGSVVFSDGLVQHAPVAVASGTASLTLPGVAAGSHTYSAVFVPTDPAAFATSSSPARQLTVAATATTTSLTGSVRGTTATLRAVVAGAGGLVPVGTVQILEKNTVVGQVQLVRGQATLSLPGAKVGAHSYRARFVPSTSDFTGSTSSVVAVTVRPAASTTTLSAAARAKSGSRPTITVQVRRGGAPATGKVLLRYGAKKVTVTLKGGKATYRLPKLKQGKLTVTASYLGNATTAKSTASRTIKVSR
jgi:hypothetical protein